MSSPKSTVLEYGAGDLTTNSRLTLRGEYILFRMPLESWAWTVFRVSAVLIFGFVSVMAATMYWVDWLKHHQGFGERDDWVMLAFVVPAGAFGVVALRRGIRTLVNWWQWGRVPVRYRFAKQSIRIASVNSRGPNRVVVKLSADTSLRIERSVNTVPSRPVTTVWLYFNWWEQGRSLIFDFRMERPGEADRFDGAIRRLYGEWLEDDDPEDEPAGGFEAVTPTRD